MSQNKNQIQHTKIKQPEGISFSFKYLALNNADFSIENTNNYLIHLLERFKDLSSWTVKELRTNNSPALRFHPIKWDETSQPNGFQIPNEEQLVDMPYQFSLSSNEYGRVHGFFIDDVFYIVWLDSEHKLYPQK